MQIGYEAIVRYVPDTVKKRADFEYLRALVPDFEEFSVITCPTCGHEEQERMPTNACQIYYSCKDCGHVLLPVAGECCVYCSYGTVECPPNQTGEVRHYADE